jgi:membrane-bound lytic murein transglycosylase B
MAKAPTEIRSLARAHTEAALRTLVGVMNQDEAPPAARVAAANSLLDRGWGKAEQRIEGEHIHRYVADVPAVSETVETWQQQHAPQTIQ